MNKLLLTLLSTIIILPVFTSHAASTYVTTSDTIYVLCESTNYKTEKCYLPANSSSVTRVRKYSRANCNEGVNYFYTHGLSHYITVKNGCRAKYRVKLSSVIKYQTISCSSILANGSPSAITECSFKPSTTYLNSYHPKGKIWKTRRASKSSCKSYYSDPSHRPIASNEGWGPLASSSIWDPEAMNWMWTAHGCRGTFSQEIAQY